MMVKDPVCGMELDLDKAFAKRTQDGRKFHFCSPECLEQFDEQPEKYAFPEEPEHSDHD